ncbi:uncharacterized protein, partial [Physeter macrocephalus]|uniref:Uncharacterized protein n=1 Tax=Physeter macrocephalus TaxID=9755 RepID=A0A455B3R7_PHYMC
MHHSRPAFQIQLRHHQRNLCYTAGGNSHTIQGYGSAIARKYLLGCADTECTYNSAIMAATVRRPLSSYICTDTFTNSLRSKISTKKVCNNIPVITFNVESSRTTTNLTNLLSRGAHLHNPTAVTGLPWWRCTGCTQDAFTPSAGTILRCKRARLLCSTSSALGSNNTFSNPATENSVDKHDGNFLSSGHHRTGAYLTLALRGFSNINSTGQLPQNQSALHHGRRKYVSNHLLYTMSYAGEATLRGATKNNIYGTFVSPSTAGLSSSTVDTPRVRPFGAQSDSLSLRSTLKSEIVFGRCNWLVSVEEEGFTSLSRMSGATRSFFFAKKTKADSSKAAPSSGSAAVAGGQSSANANTLEATSVHETSKTPNPVDTKRSGEEVEGTTQPANSDTMSTNMGVRPWSTKLRTLPVGADVRNNGVSQLGIYEDERKLVSEERTSAFPFFVSSSTKGQKKDGDALPGAGPTAA